MSEIVDVVVLVDGVDGTSVPCALASAGAQPLLEQASSACGASGHSTAG
jgi:hypothetical protein